jgi:Na+/H+ antiporter NhaC
MIAPISSWAAAVTGVFKDNGIDGDGFAYFIRAVPYNLYSLMTFVFIIAIVLMKFDYGPMKLHEMNAANGDLFTSGKHEGKGEELEEGSSRAKVIDLLFPIIALIGICVFALFYIGAGGDFSANLITAFGDTDATVGLPWGGLIALIVTLIYFIARRLISFKDAMACVPKGFIAMVPAILILTMATALKEMTEQGLYPDGLWK